MTDHMYNVKEQLFTAKTLYRELHQSQSGQFAASHALVFNDLVQLAQGNVRGDAVQMMQQINQSIPMRSQYNQLLQKLAFAVSPVQAEASSASEINRRKSAEFELLFKRDKKFPTQVYVIVKIASPLEKHTNQGVHLNGCSENLIFSVCFPPVVDGKTQLLMEESDQTFINMFDAKFAIYLS